MTTAVWEPVDAALFTIGVAVVTAEADGVATLFPRAVLAVVTAVMKVFLNEVPSAAVLAASELAEFTFAVKVILTPLRRAAMALEVTVQPVLVVLVTVFQMPIETAYAAS